MSPYLRALGESTTPRADRSRARRLPVRRSGRQTRPTCRRAYRPKPCYLLDWLSLTFRLLASCSQKRNRRLFSRYFAARNPCQLRPSQNRQGPAYWKTLALVSKRRRLSYHVLSRSAPRQSQDLSVYRTENLSRSASLAGTRLKESSLTRWRRLNVLLRYRLLRYRSPS